VFLYHILELKVQQAAPESKIQQDVPSNQEATTYNKASTGCRRKGKDMQG